MGDVMQSLLVNLRAGINEGASIKRTLSGENAPSPSISSTDLTKSARDLKKLDQSEGGTTKREKNTESLD